MKKRSVWTVAGILAALLLTQGCATKENLYFWGDYSETLYQCKKKPCETSFAEHKESLEKIIEQSNRKRRRVPPGIYAEMGYLFFNENRFTDAVRFFTLEKETYPESEPFMNRLILSAQSFKGEGVASRADGAVAPIGKDASRKAPQEPAEENTDESSSSSQE